MIIVKPEDIIKSINNADIQPIDDMINLSDLKEHAILRNLQIRYLAGNIYVSNFFVVFLRNVEEVIAMFGNNTEWLHDLAVLIMRIDLKKTLVCIFISLMNTILMSFKPVDKNDRLKLENLLNTSYPIIEQKTTVKVFVFC